jgi:hypothetical protein
VPSTPDVWSFYCDELAKLGKPDPGPCPADDTRTVALAEDPDAAWERMGPYFLHETNAYGKWLSESDGGGPYKIADDVEELRERGEYQILTPEEYVEDLRAAPFPFAQLHPLCGGMPPDLGWSSLRLLEQRVLPAFA